MNIKELEAFIGADYPLPPYDPGRFGLGSFGAHEFVFLLSLLVKHIRNDLLTHPSLRNPDPTFDLYRKMLKEATVLMTGVCVGFGASHINRPTPN